jgi:cell division protein FtsN
MEEVTTWKNHSFTMLIFGGIIVLCSIFFALGMVVGRGQGRHLAEAAFKAEEEKKAAANTTTDNFPLNFYSETTADKPALTPLKPAADPPAPTDTQAPKQAKPQSKTEKPVEKSATPPAAPQAAAPVGSTFLQVSASKIEKQAKDELKKVESKGFKATILKGVKQNETWYRVVVGPYKESELSLARKDLAAKGYKDAFPPK